MSNAGSGLVIYAEQDGASPQGTMNTSTLSAAPPRFARRHSHRAGLRTVALLEALKGVLALFAGYLLISMIRRDVDFERAAQKLLYLLHIDPELRLSHDFLRLANRLSDVHIAWIVAIALAYAVLRFAEGYGLWRQRAWAEWLAIISGCLYLPLEIYKLVRHPSLFHWAILGINVLVVLYIGWVRWDEITSAPAMRTAGSSTPYRM